ncbi:hypothetical protein E8D34_13975 [Nocardioides sp. GY 10113]|uniref:hypothetical protein n=1 Tax=Nocardioides sp. GY 10113 TaxID=2569761 RepID=UPI0010A836BB|nr:hypothetical protein [Nocardioides sp. GY 10113]TIC84820.1 hypothetical protein E8D34_13975 [Nocardioides sp. GY 10113]
MTEKSSGRPSQPGQPAQDVPDEALTQPVQPASAQRPAPAPPEAPEAATPAGTPAGTPASAPAGAAEAAGPAAAEAAGPEAAAPMHAPGAPSGDAAPVPPVAAAAGYAGPPPPPAAPAPPRLRDRVFRLRSLVGVGVAGVILGAGGGAAVTYAVADDDGRPERGVGGPAFGDRGPGGPGGQRGDRDFGQGLDRDRQWRGQGLGEGQAPPAQPDQDGVDGSDSPSD